jgi:hypothetical protein
MVPGQTFTIEPILTLGSREHRMWEDGWTLVTVDGSLAAQFEHTLLVTEEGVEVLTDAEELLEAAGKGEVLQAVDAPLQAKAAAAAAAAGGGGGGGLPPAAKAAAGGGGG